MTMKVGIIGASFARAAYLPALAMCPGAEVVAIASGRCPAQGLRRPLRRAARL
jgi:predicted dehydrogenase